MTLDNLTVFTAGTKAKASEINSNFSLIEDAVNENSTKIDSLSSNKIDTISNPISGNLTITDSNGQLADSGKKLNDDETTANNIWSANKVNSEISLLNSTLITKTSYIPQQYWTKISNNSIDSQHDIDFSAGKQPDKNLLMVMTCPALTKQIDNNWAQGNNQGGLPSNLTLSANTTYHCFVISKDDKSLKTSLYMDFETSLTNDEYGNSITAIGNTSLAGGKCVLDGITSGIRQTSITSFNKLPWEISLKFKLNSLPPSPNHMYIFRTANQSYLLRATSSGSLTLYLSSNGLDWDIANNITVKSNIEANVEYSIKLAFTGNSYQLWSSIDNEVNWIKDYETSSISTVNDFTDITFGAINSSGGSCINGTLDNISIKLVRETTDAGFDTSSSASNLLSDAQGYTKYRRVGSIITDENSDILKFNQDKDVFTWYNKPLDISSASLTIPTTKTNYPITVPSGIQVEARVRASARSNTTTCGVNLLSPSDNSLPPSITSVEDCDTFCNTTFFIGIEKNIITDTNSNISMMSSLASPISFSLRTYSYRDLFEE